MKLQIKPSTINTFPLAGILINGNDITLWVKEIQLMELSLADVDVYPISGNTANSLWGCLVACNVEKNKIDAGRNIYCQLVANHLFIPERTILSPILPSLEMEKLFAGKHILHPEFGLVELPGKIVWQALLAPVAALQAQPLQPQEGIYIPKEIKSFMVKAAPAEDALEKLEQTYFPERKTFEDKPLSFFEKAKLGLYRLLMKGTGNKKSSGSSSVGEKNDDSFLSSLLKKMNGIFPEGFTEKMYKDYEELEKRNQKKLDKLMNLFDDDPDEALKYAIPLDEGGSSRGGDYYEVDISKRWSDFSFSSNSSRSGSGTAILPSDAYRELQKRYEETAQRLITQKEYRKATFVYMKLLKNHFKAAQTLESGELYEEAASVYLKYLQNKSAAADCYEKGKMTQNAIDLHIELGNDEKAGDLYFAIKEKQKAFELYEKVVNNYEEKDQYLKASLLYKNKMENEQAAQQILLKGWRNNKDAFNCLNNYFANIPDSKLLHKELNNIYTHDVSPANRATFLQVLKPEFKRSKEQLGETISDMAYEIVAAEAHNNPDIVSELRQFNNDKLLLKDTLVYKMNRRHKISK